jgi:hypothetical protein
MNPISETGRNLVFVFGLPRSGTTLLSLILGGHPEVLAPPEPWFLLKLHFLREEGRFNNQIDDYQATIGTQQFLPDEIFLPAARAFALTAYNSYLHKNGKSLFIDKTPRYYHLVSAIDLLFPEAKKIWIKRNLLDVATSYRNTWNVKIEHFFNQASTALSIDLLEGPFKLADYFSVPDPLKIELHYENLTRDPEGQVKGVCEFLGLSFDVRMLDYWRDKRLMIRYQNAAMGDKKACKARTFYQSSVDNWKTELSTAELKLLVQGLGTDIFLRMGYPHTVSWLSSHQIYEGEGDKPCEKKNIPFPQRSDEVTITLHQELVNMVNSNNFERSAELLDQLLGYYSSRDPRRFLAVDAFVLDQLAGLKRIVEQLSFLTPFDSGYRNKRMEGAILNFAGHHDEALEILHELYCQYPEYRQELLKEIMKILPSQRCQDSSLAMKIVHTLMRELTQADNCQAHKKN